MKKLIIAAAIAAVPSLAFCAQPSQCEIVVRMWAKDMAYVSACNDKTGLEQELAQDQQVCRSIGQKRAEQLIGEEIKAARDEYLADHVAYCRNTKAMFQAVKDGMPSR